MCSFYRGNTERTNSSKMCCLVFMYVCFVLCLCCDLFCGLNLRACAHARARACVCVCVHAKRVLKSAFVYDLSLTVLM